MRAIWHALLMPANHPERQQVAERIQAAMTAKDLSIREMQDLTGIPASSLSRYLRAVTSPTLDHLAAIAATVGVSLADLMPERVA